MEVLNINWSNAFVVLGLGIGIVFIVLIMLVLLLSGFSWFFIRKEKTGTNIPIVAANAPAEAEKVAAIVMALHSFYQDVHDEESYIVSIKEKKTSWNSKILGLNNFPR